MDAVLFGIKTSQLRKRRRMLLALRRAPSLVSSSKVNERPPGRCSYIKRIEERRFAVIYPYIGNHSDAMEGARAVGWRGRDNFSGPFGC